MNVRLHVFGEASLTYVCSECGTNLETIDRAVVFHPRTEGLIFKKTITCSQVGKTFRKPTFTLEEIR